MVKKLFLTLIASADHYRDMPKFYVETWTEEAGWERVGERETLKGAIDLMEKMLPRVALPYQSPARLTKDISPPRVEWRENLKMSQTFHAEREEYVSNGQWKKIGRVWS